MKPIKLYIFVHRPFNDPWERTTYIEASGKAQALERFKKAKPRAKIVLIFEQIENDS